MTSSTSDIENTTEQASTKAAHVMANADTKFFGHPSGLTTLFFTEMWERMSYYGMRALLVLFMTASLQEEGLGFTVAAATAIYGLYTGFVYFMGLPGGWLADRLLGGKNAIFYGGVIIMLGHVILAIPNDKSFFVGLIFVVLGTGLLKPNITALVGQLYSATDHRRDSGYAIYYMGINIGAFFGYLVCGYLANNIGWHWGFGAAAVGMALGLIQYKFTANNLSTISSAPPYPLGVNAKKVTVASIVATLILLIIITSMALTGKLTINAEVLAQYTAKTFAFIFLLYYAAIFFLGKLTLQEKKQLGALFLICIASACFWSGFEQAGSSLNLFARDYTDRMIGSFEIPTTWFQTSNTIFIVLLTPFIAALWINLAKRMVTPSYGLKCAVGIIVMACGFIVMFFAAQIAASGLKVAPYWLVATYFLHTVGELCLSPVALSAVSKLSPKRFAGQMMGIFVLTYSIGNVISGLVAGNFEHDNLAQIPNLYLQISVFSIAIGIAIFLLSFKTKIWEQGENSANGKSNVS